MFSNFIFESIINIYLIVARCSVVETMVPSYYYDWKFIVIYCYFLGM